MFTIGGTDLFIHKYLGTNDGEVVKDHTQIQDLVFMENRDRTYDPSIYSLRGIYNVQDNDFDLSQFGLFLSNDTLYVTVHINSSIHTVGRKIMSGDVIELPHLKDEHAANDFATALKRFYVVEDVNRAAEGFSPTWYPHLYRLKIKQIVDSQEFKDILDRPEEEELFEGEYDPAKPYYEGQIVRLDGILFRVLQDTTGNSPSEPNSIYFESYDGNSLRDILSTYNQEINVSQGVVAEAEGNTPLSGYDVTSNYFTLAVNQQGQASVAPANSGDIDPSTLLSTPVRYGYLGYLTGDSVAPNGAPYGQGISFPTEPELGDYFMRMDFIPLRLFRFDGAKWKKVHDVVRTSLSTDNPNTQRGSFINNINEYTYEDRVAVDFDNLTVGQTVIDTEIASTVLAPYLQLYYESDSRDGTITINYTVADHANMFTEYTVDGVSLLRIQLPAAIEYVGLYTISLYNSRQSQRQALSSVLRPRADN